jgi:hypothetical protein
MKDLDEGVKQTAESEQFDVNTLASMCVPSIIDNGLPWMVEQQHWSEEWLAGSSALRRPTKSLTAQPRKRGARAPNRTVD